jgi:hypothetical protein
MRVRYVVWVVALIAALALAACNKAEPTPESAIVLPEGEMAGPQGSLQGATRLALGLLQLEGTEQAVTAEQAGEMLPLWKAIQGGALQGTAETEAVLKQIDGVLDEDQSAAIEGMELTFQDLQAWMESPAAQALGIEIPMPAGGQGAQGGQAPGALGDLSEEERTKMREEFSSMSAEERATRMAEMGVERPEGQQGGGMGARPGGAGRQANVLLGPLVELLTERSAG